MSWTSNGEPLRLTDRAVEQAERLACPSRVGETTAELCGMVYGRPHAVPPGAVKSTTLARSICSQNQAGIPSSTTRAAQSQHARNVCVTLGFSMLM
jgi:hypothetical protein